MQFNDIHKQAIEAAISYTKRHDIPLSPTWAMTKLFEEVGEYAQAYLVYTDQCRTSKRIDKDSAKEELTKELADVLGFVLLNAHLHDIDIMDALSKKWIPKTTK